MWHFRESVQIHLRCREQKRETIVYHHCVSLIEGSFPKQCCWAGARADKYFGHTVLFPRDSFQSNLQRREQCGGQVVSFPASFAYRDQFIEAVLLGRQISQHWFCAYSFYLFGTVFKAISDAGSNFGEQLFIQLRLPSAAPTPTAARHPSTHSPPTLHTPQPSGPKLPTLKKQRIFCLFVFKFVVFSRRSSSSSSSSRVAEPPTTGDFTKKNLIMLGCPTPLLTFIATSPSVPL